VRRGCGRGHDPVGAQGECALHCQSAGHAGGAEHGDGAERAELLEAGGQRQVPGQAGVHAGCDRERVAAVRQLGADLCAHPLGHGAPRRPDPAGVDQPAIAGARYRVHTGHQRVPPGGAVVGPGGARPDDLVDSGADQSQDLAPVGRFGLGELGGLRAGAGGGDDRCTHEGSLTKLSEWPECSLTVLRCQAWA
jgi:hypothetical protein